jgi:hypothetical protein
MQPIPGHTQLTCWTLQMLRCVGPTRATTAGGEVVWQEQFVITTYPDPTPEQDSGAQAISERDTPTAPIP